MQQLELDKKEVQTLVGYYNDNNTFTTIEGDIISAMSYRIINKQYNSDMLVCVNMRWSEKLNSWVIFQVVQLD